MTDLVIGLDGGLAGPTVALSRSVARSSNLGAAFPSNSRLARPGDEITSLGCVIQEAGGARTYSVQLHTVVDFGDNGQVKPGIPVGPVVTFAESSGSTVHRRVQAITPFVLTPGVRYCVCISQTVGSGTGLAVTTSLVGAVSVRDATLTNGVFNNPWVRSSIITDQDPHVFALGTQAGQVDPGPVTRIVQKPLASIFRK